MTSLLKKASSVFLFFLYFIDFSIIMYYFTPTKNNKQNKNNNKGKEQDNKGKVGQLKHNFT